MEKDNVFEEIKELICDFAGISKDKITID